MKRGAQSSRRPAPRKRERGAAMVEAVVVIPFFITIFASILFVGNMYRTKMRAMRVTKESAWNFAMCNCGKGGDGLTSACRAVVDGVEASEAGGETPDTPEATSAVSKAGGGPEGDIASKNFGSSEATYSLEVGADKYIGGYTKRMSSRTKVMCNEPPYDGSILGWAKAAFSGITSW